MEEKQKKDTQEYTEEVFAMLDDMRTDIEINKAMKGASGELDANKTTPMPKPVRVKTFKSDSLYGLERSIGKFIKRADVINMEYSTNAISYGTPFVEIEREYSVVILYKEQQDNN